MRCLTTAHVLVKMLPGRDYSDQEIEARYKLYFGADAVFPVGRLAHFRSTWSSLFEFMWDVKQTFSRYYNKVKGRRGTLWGERFMNRTRYFTDSGIIGTQAFVAEHDQRFKHLFQSRHEKNPRPINGLDGMYSLKQLSF